ncbi:fructose-6-phosphate aldolase [Tropicibacter naphthalenivorans]|uniref:Probable transaldolase n=1 Tax=Tropicibacter naphthalenivorans TaxID=441103 RepID=A0A0N7M085_9RHOB|nr:fructose-6-phosphate aldolase [Tropicibacter naphthalenivorans]CUH79761.1 putative transaldolase [Tropicibacter naphthalenivorans]SMC75009.1 transaldolase [Tropicibacter naphthalenivorans]
MKFFADTAVIEDIKDLNDYGLLDGVTTNPTLIAKSGRDFKEVIAEICSVVDGPVSAEVAAMDFPGMIAEGEHLAEIADNVVIKLPLTLEGLKACRHFNQNNIKTNVTLCFSANQALLAAKAGATYISPFVGRLDDLNLDGLDLIQDIRTIYDNFGFETQILAASVRTANHVKDVAIAGADVATVPAAVIKGLANHVLTDKGLEQFAKDWAETGQSIL